MKTLKEIMIERALYDVNTLEVRNAKELADKARAEIANAKKFWAVWNEDARAGRVCTFTRRARDMQAKAKELMAGRFDAHYDYSAIVMLYVTAIRELTAKHFAL